MATASIYAQRLWCPDCGRRGEAVWRVRPAAAGYPDLLSASSGFYPYQRRARSEWPTLVCGCGTVQPSAFFGRHSNSLQLSSGGPVGRLSEDRL